jgi:hypothetical protein
MNLTEWSRSSIDYGRKLVSSGLEGAKTGEEEYLDGDELSPYLGDSARHAIAPGVIGICIGALTGYYANRRRSAWRAFGFGLLGGLLGFGASLAWESRGLGRCIVSDALKSINKVRDEHWLEKHPIDYA